MDSRKSIEALDKFGVLDYFDIKPTINSGEKDPFGNYLNVDIGDKVVRHMRDFKEDGLIFGETETKIIRNDEVIYHNTSIDYLIVD